MLPLNAVDSFDFDPTGPPRFARLADVRVEKKCPALLGAFPKDFAGSTCWTSSRFWDTQIRFYIVFPAIGTPCKINMEGKITPFEKKNHLLNLRLFLCSMFIFGGVPCFETLRIRLGEKRPQQQSKRLTQSTGVWSDGSRLHCDLKPVACLASIVDITWNPACKLG